MDFPQTFGYPLSDNSDKIKYLCSCTGKSCAMMKIEDEHTDICNKKYDTISIIDGNLCIFKDKYVWEFRNKKPHPDNPYRIDEKWKFPNDDDFNHIDAVYQNKENKTVFFIGKNYYIFNGNTLEDGYPKPLTNLGLSSTLDKIDAAFIWGYNNRTYFFSGTSYWGFDEDERKIELNYPRDISLWVGVGYHINGAFQHKNGKSYFFKNNFFWAFNDERLRVTHMRPKRISQKWIRCQNDSENIN